MKSQKTKFYENLTKDVLRLSQDDKLIKGQLNDEVIEGINIALESLNLSPSEQLLLENRYMHLLTYEQCGLMYGVSHQKAKSDIERLLNKIRASSKYEHFFHGKVEGDYQQYEADRIFTAQRKFVETGEGRNLAEEILDLNVRYLVQHGISQETIEYVYKRQLESIRDVFSARENGKLKLPKQEEASLKLLETAYHLESTEID